MTEGKIILDPQAEGQGLRTEIVALQCLQMLVPFIAAIAIIFFAFLADSKRNLTLTVLNATLAIGAVFFVGRMDFLIHRVGRYLREAMQSPYETWKAKHRNVQWLILYDVMSALPILASFGYNEYVMRKFTFGNYWCDLTVAFFVFGLVEIPLAVKMANAR